MARKYRVISGDGHIDLNPDVWRDRVSARWRERAPKRVKMPDGMDAIVCDGSAPYTIGVTRTVGRSKTWDRFKEPPTFENGAGSGPPEQRVREQDQDGVDAEILYSQISNMLREVKENDFYLDCIRSYNNFLAEEYQAAAPDRLIPMGMLPLTGVDDAIKEYQRCAKIGLRGVKLDTFPNGKGYPMPEDDKFWAAAVDLKLPLTNHGDGFLTVDRRSPSFVYEKEPGTDAVHVKDPFSYFFRFTSESMKGATQMAFAGVWDRFPTLEIYWAETMIGWLEYGLWQIDDHYERYMDMIHANWGLERLERQPSEYIKERNYWGFLHDPVGVKRRKCIGTDKLMWATDFAHAASDWPNSMKFVAQDFAGVPEDEKHAMLAGNTMKFFHLDEG